MMQVSDETLFALLRARLRSAGVFHLFVRKLGPNDVVYAHAYAFDAAGKIVELKATADELDDALALLFLNVDTATVNIEEEP